MTEKKEKDIDEEKIKIINEKMGALWGLLDEFNQVVKDLENNGDVLTAKKKADRITGGMTIEDCESVMKKLNIEKENKDK